MTKVIKKLKIFLAWEKILLSCGKEGILYIIISNI